MPRPTPETPAVPATAATATTVATRQVRPGWWHRAHRLTLRGLQPPDAPLLQGLYEGLSPLSRRQRFHGMLRPSAATVRGLCRVDGQRQRAWLVVDETESADPVGTGAGVVSGGRALAEARWVLGSCGLPDGTAEFALLVAEAWRQRGLGRWVLKALVQDAAAQGMVWLQGDVLEDNLGMRQLLRGCGFALCPHPHEAGLLLAQRRLSVADAAERAA